MRVYLHIFESQVIRNAVAALKDAIEPICDNAVLPDTNSHENEDALQEKKWRKQAGEVRW